MNANAQMDQRGIILGCPQCNRRNRIEFESLARIVRCGQCHTELPASGDPIEVDAGDKFFELITRSSLPVLVDFWAPWCGPCKMVAPEVEKLAGELAREVLVAKVNTEALPEVAQRFAISGIPTFVLFHSGKEVARQSGAMSAAHLRRFIEQALAMA